MQCAFLAPFFLAFNSWTVCWWGKRDRIHRSIYILPNESMICPYYVYHSNLPHAMFYFFYNFFFILSLSFSVHWVKLWIKPNGNISQRSRDCRSNNWISMKKHNLFVILKYTWQPRYFDFWVVDISVDYLFNASYWPKFSFLVL